MNAVLNHPRFQDEAEAYKWVEAHLWPHGPQCPRCGVLGDRIHKMQGKSTRIGAYKCRDCRKPFTVKIGTIFEDSHIPMHYWLQAIALLTASKKGISSNQLHRMMGITLKSAWFMSHRIREAMRVGGLKPPMGGDGGVVEIDETVYGRAATHPKGRKNLFTGSVHKNIILSLVERGGKVRSFHGNVGMLVRAYAYILALGGDGCTQATRMAVLSKFMDGQVIIADDLVLAGPKTKEIVGVLKAIKIGTKTTEKGDRDVTLLDTTVLIGTDKLDPNVYKSARNIDGVKVAPQALEEVLLTLADLR